MLLGGKPHPHPKGAGPSVPKFLGPPTCVHTVWERTTKFYVVSN